MGDTLGRCLEQKIFGDTVELSSEETLEEASHKERKRFIRFVTLIVLIELLISAGLCSTFIFIKEIQEYVAKSKAIYIGSYILALLVYLVLIVIDRLFRHQCIAFLYTLLITAIFSLSVAIISAYHKTDSILMTICITNWINFGFFIFSCQAKFRLTVCLTISILVLQFIVSFTTIAIIVRNEIKHAIFGGIGAIFTGSYLAYDTYRISSGRKHNVAKHNYFHGSLRLYSDVVLSLTKLDVYIKFFLSKNELFTLQ
ncbi:hypothetical protein SNEBB_008382 [Seison nebaliae]|nr:hypothetical protein SNEBB_008382 [Seison nebaliae]